MKVVFMGTPDFSVGALEAIIEAGHEVTAVITQPDKPKGRGKEVQMTPVKVCALKHNIEVFQPIKIKTPESMEELCKFKADIFVVVAFGQILSEEILVMPKYGCMNIHASILPKYRGSAPIQWAILNGEKETGITIIQMDKGIDTGDMLLKSVVPIEKKETGESLHDKLSKAGAELIVKALTLVEKGELTGEKQNEEASSYAPMLRKTLGQIDWSKDAESIERLVRGLNSWPSAYTYYESSENHRKTLKIWEAELSEEDTEKIESACGVITQVDKSAFYVSTGKGWLKVTEVQLEGKKRMKVKDFQLGYKLESGMKLGQ